MKKIIRITLISIGPIITVHGISVQPESVEQPTMLMNYARMGNLSAVQATLLRAPGTINAIRNGTTALIEAARQGHADIVEVLLEHGAHVRLEGTSGASNGVVALTKAAEGGHVKVVDLLINAGTDMSLRVVNAILDTHIIPEAKALSEQGMYMDLIMETLEIKYGSSIRDSQVESTIRSEVGRLE